MVTNQYSSVSPSHVMGQVSRLYVHTDPDGVFADALQGKIHRAIHKFLYRQRPRLVIIDLSAGDEQIMAVRCIQ